MNFCIYENPETSEVADEFKTLLDALKFRSRPHAQAVRNGVIYAHVVNGRWVLTARGAVQVLAEARE